MDIKPGDHVDIVMQKGSDFLVLAFLVPVIAVSRSICERVSCSYFQTTDVAQKVSRKKTKLIVATKKFEESFWKWIYYSISAVLGILLFAGDSEVWTPYRVYPNIITPRIYWFYMIQIAFYLWMSVSLIWDVRRKDFYQMAAHHGITLCLLIGSYTFSITNAGALVMVFHDIADPFLEFAKLCSYLKKENSSGFFFVAFATTFIVMRLYMYPYYAMSPCLFHTWGLAVAISSESVYYFLNTCMVLLLGLNVFWTVLILKVITTKIIHGDELKDSRSDAESD